jgi:hypothetical protein
MKRILALGILFGLVLSASAGAETSMSIGITLGNAPPPPVVQFHGQPRLVALPTVGIAYYDGPCDYDYFRYGAYFYIYDNGYWYRSAYHRGPFVAIRESNVPRAFYGLHDRGYRWHHPWKNAPAVSYRGEERRLENVDDRGDHGHHGHQDKHEHKDKHDHD